MASFRKHINITNNSKPRRKYEAVILFVIFALSVLITPIFQSINVNAVTKSTDKTSDADWQIKSSLYSKSIAYCLRYSALIDGGVWSNKINDSHATSNQWFFKSWLGMDNGFSANTGVYVTGYTGDKDDGKINCGDSSLIRNALSLWGLSPTVVLCNSGFKRVDLGDNQTVETCVNGKTDFQRAKDASDTSEKFTAYIKNVIYDGKNPELTDAEKYVFYKQSLAQSCIKSINGTPPSPTSTNDDNRYGYNGVKWVDISTQSIITGSYLGDLKKDTLIILQPNGEYIGAADVKTCSDTVSEMNRYAESYLQKIKSDSSFAEDEQAAGSRAQEENEDVSTCNINGVGWIVCPVVNFLASMADGAFGFLSKEFLSTSPEIFNSSSPTFEAWKVMRSIANVAFVIAFLIIIFSQMTSVGISNYGIKKLLPRLVIAAILVNISYYICQIAVDLSNILGYSLKDTLSNLVPDGVENTDGWIANGTIFGGIAAAAIGGAIVWASLAAIIPMIIAALVALVMILFILIARQALIILLIVISPLAFVAFLLPNTEDWFKKWRKAFTAMLILFPVIAVVFGMSSLAAGILSDTFSKTDSNMGKIVAAAVMVLPLFVVPGLLKKSLDGVGSIGAKINGLGDKMGGALGKKGSEAFSNTAIARGREARKQYKQMYRDQKYFKNMSETDDQGNLTKRARFTRAMARGFRGNVGLTESDRFANERQTTFTEAAADKADTEAVNNKMIYLNNSFKAGKQGMPDLKAGLRTALENGDSVSARAHTKVLASQGGAGKTALRETISDFQLANSNASDAAQVAKLQNADNLRKTILGLGLKKDDAVLNDFGVSGGMMSETGTKASTFSGLSSAELSTQSKNVIENAMKGGAISSKQAQDVLSNPNTSQNLGDKKPLFEEIARSNISHDTNQNPNQPTLGF